jgi:hypothetical protein
MKKKKRNVLFNVNYVQRQASPTSREIHTFFFFFFTTVYLVLKVSFAVDKKMFPNLLTQLSISGCVIFSLSKLSNCVSRSCIVFIFKLFKKSILSESFHFRGFSELFTVHVFSSSCAPGSHGSASGLNFYRKRYRGVYI